MHISNTTLSPVLFSFYYGLVKDLNHPLKRSDLKIDILEYDQKCLFCQNWHTSFSDIAIFTLQLGRR